MRHVLDITNVVTDIASKNLNLPLPLINSNNGLYIFLFVNNSKKDIHDKNIKRESREAGITSGKIVVPHNSTVIKFGKYENGFNSRLSSYLDHMHFAGDADNKELALSKCLKSCFLFDLDLFPKLSYSLSHSRVLEKAWNGAIDFYLSQNNLLSGKQMWRSEYRIIRSLSEEDIKSLALFSDEISLRLEEVCSILAAH